jgi:hypothetical protein
MMKLCDDLKRISYFMDYLMIRISLPTVIAGRTAEFMTEDREGNEASRLCELSV